jgi:hypothetical protein
MKHSKWRKIAAASAVVFATSLPAVALAQTDYVGPTPVPAAAVQETDYTVLPSTGADIGRLAAIGLSALGAGSLLAFGSRMALRARKA